MQTIAHNIWIDTHYAAIIAKIANQERRAQESVGQKLTEEQFGHLLSLVSHNLFMVMLPAGSA